MYGLRPYRLSAAGRPGLIFGYATLDEHTIRTGVELLAEAIGTTQDQARRRQRASGDAPAPRRYTGPRRPRSNRSVRSLIALRPSRGGAGAPYAS